jgi:hypothetical protein
MSEQLVNLISSGPAKGKLVRQILDQFLTDIGARAQEG